MRLLLVSLFLLVFCDSSYAQDTYTRYKLPVGRRVHVADETFECFDLHQYKQLLLIDAELKYYEDHAAVLGEEVKAVETQMAAVYEKLALEEQKVVVLSVRLEEQHLELEKATAAAIKSLEQQVRLRKWLFAVAGVAVAGIGGVVLGATLSN